MTIGYTARALVHALMMAVLMPVAVAQDAFLAFGDIDGDGVAIIPALLLLILVPLAAVSVPMYARAVWRGLLRRPLLTLDDDGVTLHSAWVSLPWPYVAEIWIARMIRRGRQDDLLVFVAAEPPKARGLPGWFARDATRRFGGPVYLRVKDLTRPLDDVLAEARRRTTAPVTRRTVLKENLPRQI